MSFGKICRGSAFPCCLDISLLTALISQKRALLHMRSCSTSSEFEDVDGMLPEPTGRFHRWWSSNLPRRPLSPYALLLSYFPFTESFAINLTPVDKTPPKSLPITLNKQQLICKRFLISSWYAIEEWSKGLQSFSHSICYILQLVFMAIACRGP